MSLNTTAATWVTGTVVTAAQLNLEVRDAINGIQSAWTAFVPTITGSVSNPVLGNAVASGRYRQIGKTADYAVDITFGSTSTYGSGTWFLTLPLAARATSPAHIGHGFISAGASRKMIACELNTTGNVNMVTADAGAVLTNAAPFAWANGNTLRASISSYELA